MVESEIIGSFKIHPPYYPGISIINFEPIASVDSTFNSPPWAFTIS